MKPESVLKKTFNKLLPSTVDNKFEGSKISLYAFYVLTAITLWRSQHHLFAHDGGAQSIATIPLDAYSTAAADTIVGVFSLWGLSQLLLGIVYLTVSLRYRSLIPLMYLLFVLEYLARLLIGVFRNIETAGTAPGSVANLPFVALGIVLFIFCFKYKK